MDKVLLVGAGAGIAIVLIIIASGILDPDDATPMSLLKSMVEEWQKSPDGEKSREIMRVYYTLEESGQKIEPELDDLIHEQIRAGIPYAELFELKDSVRKQAGSDLRYETRTLYIDSTLEDCIGVGPQKCMLVREDPDSDWSLFYSRILDFEYHEGTQYKISVAVSEVANPPADASSLRYALIDILEESKP